MPAGTGCTCKIAANISFLMKPRPIGFNRASDVSIRLSQECCSRTGRRTFYTGRWAGRPTANASGHRRAIIDYKMSPQQAIEAPRWLQGRMLDLSQPGTLLNLEGRVRDDVVLELRRLGHRINLTRITPTSWDMLARSSLIDRPV